MKSLLGLFLLCSLLIGCQTTPKPQVNQSAEEANSSRVTPSPPTSPVVVSQIIINLAALDGVEKDSEQVRQMSVLLSSLDKKYPEDSTRIADLTAGAYQQIQTRGKKVRVLNIMKEMLETPNRGNNYSDIIEIYVKEITKE